MDNILVLIVLFSLIVGFTSYRVDIAEEDEAKYCEFRKHLTLKPTSTCCAGNVITPGLDIATYINNCEKESLGTSDTIEGLSWNTYRCILKACGAKDEFGLQDFADIMTANYPEDIKKGIDEEVQKQSSSNATLTDNEALNKIRTTYFDIEKAVCEGSTSESSSTYGTIEECVSAKEEQHRGGLCCQTPNPVDLRYKSSLDQSISSKQFLANDCKEKIHDELTTKYFASETEEANILEICEITCLFFYYKIFFPEQIFKNDLIIIDLKADVEELAKAFPTALSGMLDEAKEYVISTISVNDTIDEMKDFVFKDIVRDHYVRRRFTKQLIHFPTICAVHQRIVTLMEHAVFRKCNADAGQ